MGSILISNRESGMPRKTTIKILNKCESSSQTRNTNLSCLKLNWKKRNNFVLEDEMQHIWYQTEKVVHYCFIRIWIEKSILVQLHNWVWNLVKKTSVNLSYTMQLRQHVRDSLEWVKTPEKNETTWSRRRLQKWRWRQTQLWSCT